MGTPSFTAHVLFAPLQQLAGWIGRQAGPVQRRSSRAAAPAAPVAHRPAPVHRPVPAATRRLRVVRVFEGPQAAAGAGRMVICGRMADVCAELERLAALEAAAG